MLLPTKGISFDRALLTIGADILEALTAPTSVSGLWERFTSARKANPSSERVTFDWFSLALASLYAVGAVESTRNDYIRRSGYVSP
jgi:hypothetical protein